MSKATGKQAGNEAPAKVPVWRVKTYRTCRIERVMADKVTDASVFISGGRVARVSDSGRYFLSFDEAHAYAEARLRRQVDQLQKDLASAEEQLAHVLRMTEGDVPLSEYRY